MSGQGSWRLCTTVAMVALASGCLIVPKARRTEQRRYHHDSSMKPVTEAVPEMAVRPHGPALEVEARWRRTCAIWRSEIVEYEIRRSAGLESLSCGGGEGCLYVALFALALAPVTLPISGAITAISLSGEEPTTRREVASQQEHRLSCDAPGAQFRVRATRPGHPPLQVTTDEAGRARILLSGPGPIGTITVRVDAPPGVRPVRIHLGPPGTR